ncbi:MAG: flagellar export chaperone FliS [Deltaproteobacteria bacterium]|nr:flagellar export chaperone FliS [Deltaproteobacteria bacterium]
MDLNYSFTQYQKTRFVTADQGRLILMMYDGAIRFIEQAKTKMERGDIPGKGIAIARAQGIISELNGSLNREKGGQLALSLETLYLYINNQLSMANLKNSQEHLDDALKVIRELLTGWKAIIQRPNSQRLHRAARDFRPETASAL